MAYLLSNLACNPDFLIETFIETLLKFYKFVIKFKLTLDQLPVDQFPWHRLPNNEWLWWEQATNSIDSVDSPENFEILSLVLNTSHWKGRWLIFRSMTPRNLAKYLAKFQSMLLNIWCNQFSILRTSRGLLYLANSAFQYYFYTELQSISREFCIDTFKRAFAIFFKYRISTLCHF